MIKAGEVVSIKTTGEAVYVLEVDQINSFGDVKVRRPVSGQNGINHIIEYFFLDELESLEDQRKRFMSEREELLAKYAPKPSETSTTPDSGFGLN